MNEELEFLLENDENILDAEISDVIDRNGKQTVGISITVGKSNGQCADIISNLKEGEPHPRFEAFEIVLTKSDLRKINKAIKDYEY